MYEYIIGTVKHKKPDRVVIEANSIGYRVLITLKTFEKIKNEVEKLYTLTYIKEESVRLYGFYTEEERDTFSILINVSGIGPKLALTILSTYDIAELKKIINDEDINRLTNVPGLGIKKSKKFLLEVKDKIVNDIIDNSRENIGGNSQLKEDIILALQALGYTKKEIVSALDNNNFSYNSIQDGVKELICRLTKTNKGKAAS